MCFINRYLCGPRPLRVYGHVRSHWHTTIHFWTRGIGNAFCEMSDIRQGWLRKGLIYIQTDMSLKLQADKTERRSKTHPTTPNSICYDNVQREYLGVFIEAKGSWELAPYHLVYFRWCAQFVLRDIDTQVVSMIGVVHPCWLRTVAV